MDASRIRPLTENDLPALLQLSTLAGWNQTVDDWRVLLEIAPSGCVGIEADGAIVASATLVEYGKRLGWIGMVLTHPDYRHRGLARRLLLALLDQADGDGIRTLKLDATEQGQPLYASLEFIAEQPLERWSRGVEKSSATEVKFLREDFPQWLDFDAAAFGIDRSAVLTRLNRGGERLANSAAYLLYRPGRATAHLGPCVAADPTAAREVLARAIAKRSNSGWSWDLLPENRNAVSIATQLGFLPQRRLVRMFRGERFDAINDSVLIYAIAGFALG